MRNSTMADYLRIMRFPKPCYAGLLHTEMTFEGEVMVITFKCDTCDYTRTEKKPYQKPEPVKEGEVLTRL